MNEITWSKLVSDWEKAIIKILAIAPNAILDAEKPKTKAHTDLITRLIPALIVVLSAASITNLSTRAYGHHASWSSYLVGTGLAALVPLAVFVAIKIEGNAYKAVVWIIASIFAFISAVIQYQVYLPVAGIPTTAQELEALAFGAGVPVAECLLAAMEAFILSQIARKVTEAQAQESAKQKQSAEDDRKHQQEAREQANEQRKRDIELAAYAAQLAQDAEAKRLELQAKLDIERLKAEAKLQQKSVEKPTKKRDENSTPTGEESENSTGKKAKIQQRRNMIFQHIKMNGDPGPTALSEQFDVDRGTIYGDLKAMEKAGIVHQNGAGWTPGPHP